MNEVSSCPPTKPLPKKNTATSPVNFVMKKKKKKLPCEQTPAIEHGGGVAGGGGGGGIIIELVTSIRPREQRPRKAITDRRDSSDFQATSTTRNYRFRGP